MSIRSWFRRWRLDEHEWKDEINAHLEIAAKQRLEAGADPDDARYAALREFGNVTLTTEAARRVWWPSWFELARDAVADARYALRALARQPGFSLTVIAVLTLGIGVNATVFSMLKGLALSPVAGVDRSAQLAVIFGETSAGRPVRLSYPDFQRLREHDRAFTKLFGTIVGRMTLGRGRDAEQLWGEIVTGDYFDALGVRAQHGRLLQPSDEIAPGAHPVVVISDSLWRRRFSADPAIVGQTIDVNTHPLTVVGIADAAFHGTTVVYDVDLYLPVMMAPQLGFTFGTQGTSPSAVLSDPRATFFYPNGFLRPGVSLETARAQTAATWSALAGDRPLTDAAQRVRVVEFWQTPGGAPTILLPTVAVLTAMGLLVLAIACANIAGLVLVRAVSRRGEIAVRLALGASRARIVRLLIVENVVLAIPAALAGVELARRAIPLLSAYAQGLAAPDRIFFNVGVDPLVIGFAAAVACGSAFVFGLAPALKSARLDLVSVINEDASPRGAGRGRIRAGLVIAQVAVSLVLLVGAGLVNRSLDAARRASPGFDPTNVTAVNLEVRQNGYDEARGRVFYRKLLDAAGRDAGVEAATLSLYLPMGLTERPVQRMAIDGYEPQRGEDIAFTANIVGPDYFRTLRIPLRAGRDFEMRDDETGAPVAVVNETLARRFWNGTEQAIGRRVRVGTGEWRTVVGVAADVKYARIDEAPRPYVYVPFFQSYRSAMVLHTRGVPVDRLVEQARAHVGSLDADLPILRARPMPETLRGAFMLFELAATLLLVFGASGIALAALGTYGLVSYSVKQSTREIGIRMALGATGARILRVFAGRGLRLGAIGTIAGIAGALAIGRLIRGVLYGVSPTDVMSFASAAALVLAIVTVATIVPAWRASRTNPLTALRHS